MIYILTVQCPETRECNHSREHNTSNGTEQGSSKVERNRVAKTDSCLPNLMRLCAFNEENETTYLIEDSKVCDVRKNEEKLGGN